ncbi:MAG TPA: ABC transporter ATP-binding protein [Armatimonadota bacterium]
MSTKKTTVTVDPMQRFGPGRGMMMGAGASVKDRRGTMRRLWNYLCRERGGLMGVALLVAVSTALGLSGPYLIGRGIASIRAHDLAHLARLVGLMLLMYLLNSAGTWVFTVWMIRIAQRTIATIRRDLFEKLQTLSLRFFDRHQHGELMSRLANDTDTISATLADSVTQFIGSILSVVGAGVIIFWLNWRLALATLLPLPVMILTVQWIARRTRQGFRDRQKTLGALNGMIEETIIGQRVVKVCQREGEVEAHFTETNAELQHSATKALIAVGLLGPGMQVFRNIGFAVLAGTGAWLVIVGLSKVETVASFLYLADYFNRPLMQLANLYGTIQSALAGAERVFAVMDEAPEMVDAAEAVELAGVQGDVEFAHVDFSYVPEVPVLTDVSFHARAGQTIALVGPTGAGKTTIINLLTRFYDIDAGEIRVDGQDIRTLHKDSLRRSLGIVLQDTYLFAGTVQENIRYGRLDATDADVEAAARLANAESFIRHLPHGFQTVLSDAGSSLSQGQRQLLAIARAMLADPAILILDEATSSVDTRTEIHIQEAMHRLMEGRTSFIIAHRLSTVRTADSILVIEGGRIVERGTHPELLAQQGAYYRLYTSQASSGTAPAKSAAE